MKNILFAIVVLLGCALGNSARAVTINFDMAILHEPDGTTPLADGNTLLIIASTANSTFGNLTSSNSAPATNFTDEADDVILAQVALDSLVTYGVPGGHGQVVNFNLGDHGVTGGNPLLFVWYSGLPQSVNPTSPGPARSFGTFRATNWVVPSNNGDIVDLSMVTPAAGALFGDTPNATEEEGRARQTTTGSANNPPVATCQDVTKAGGTNCTATVLASEVDNGSADPDGNAISLSLSPPGPYSLGTTPVVLTVTDEFGATNSCAATVTVTDNTLPTVICSANIVTQIPASEVSAIVNFGAPTASDNCGVASTSCSPASGSSFPVGTNTVTCTAVDTSGNTNTCTFTVQVLQQSVVNTAPVALCQEVTRTVTTNCAVTVTAAEVDNGSSDPDGDPFTLGLSPTGPFSAGTNAVTLTVADNRGGTNTCAANVIVVDDGLPAVACVSDVSTQVLPGVTSAIVSFGAPTASDNCAVAAVSCSPVSGSSFPLGTNSVTCTATDASGNTNSCSFNVIVSEANTNVYDLAVVGVKAPKRVRLSANHATFTGQARVTIQNRGPQAETINSLAGLIDLQVIGLTNNCPSLGASLLTGKPQRALPVTLRPKQKLTVYFQVAYSTACLPDLRQTTKRQHFDDYRYVATVNHAALDGNADTTPANDTCPRVASGSDPGCGEVITDAYLWFW